MGQEVTSSLSSEAEAWKRGSGDYPNSFSGQYVRFIRGLGIGLILATSLVLSGGCGNHSSKDNDKGQANETYKPRSPHLDHNRPHIHAERGKTVLIDEDE